MPDNRAIDELTYMIDFDNALNEEQRAAVFAPDGPVLVIAAAGTGKTRTLTYRVAMLVERGIAPSNILLLTFTNRAAHEMLDRARGLVGDSVGGLWGGTFHHMANRILKRHAAALDYGHDYTIMDQDDTRRLIRMCVDELGLRSKQFPKPDVLLKIFSLAHNADLLIEDLVRDRFAYLDVPAKQIMAVYNAFAKRKHALNAMDFDDLLVNVRTLFRRREDILERYQERFIHVLVDEYQDTNPIQAWLVDALAAKNKNLLVVGDDFQSIYSWRGADFRNIMTFPDRYEGSHIFKLETNYRSAPEILDVANACIEGNPEQYQKTLRAVRDKHKKPVIARMRDGMQQARYVVQRIRLLLREGYKLSDFTVLYRSHFHAMELQIELTRERLDYVITSGVRFFEQAHIKDVCTVIRLISNPADELSFQRLMSMVPGVGEKTAVKIWSALHQRFNPASAEARDLVIQKVPKKGKESWAGVAAIFAQFSEEEIRAKPGELLYAFADDFYDEIAKQTYDNYPNRRDDINELIAFTSRFKNVDDLLSEVALLSNVDDGNQQPDDDDHPMLRLSTIHQAKGLEWPVVFILWLAESMFPSAHSMDNEQTIAEERRLFYVAATRAKDELYMCMPEMRRDRTGGLKFYNPSRFVKELPRDLTQREQCSFNY